MSHKLHFQVVVQVRMYLAVVHVYVLPNFILPWETFLDSAPERGSIGVCIFDWSIPDMRRRIAEIRHANTPIPEGGSAIMSGVLQTKLAQNGSLDSVSFEHLRSLGPIRCMNIHAYTHPHSSGPHSDRFAF